METMQELSYILRIILAGICGMIIGLERKNRSKEAGVRTHFVVACGAALMMVVSKYAFFDLVRDMDFADVDVRLDPSRIASTIASGIGFLGAGMIFVHKNTISGLTTAAGIWATSGVGMAIGAGMYAIGVGATLIILLAQYLLHIDFHKSKNARLRTVSIKEVTESGYQKYIMQEFSKYGIIVQGVSVEVIDSEGTKNYRFKLELPANLDEDDVIAMINHKCSVKLSV